MKQLLTPAQRDVFNRAEDHGGHLVDESRRGFGVAAWTRTVARIAGKGLVETSALTGALTYQFTDKGFSYRLGEEAADRVYALLGYRWIESGARDLRKFDPGRWTPTIYQAVWNEIGRNVWSAYPEVVAAGATERWRDLRERRVQPNLDKHFVITRRSVGR